MLAAAPVDVDSLYKTDEEIARLVGVGVDKWRANARVLERQGLPLRDPLFCERRYWPSVRAFLDRRNGLHPGNEPQTRTWKEYFDEPRTSTPQER